MTVVINVPSLQQSLNGGFPVPVRMEFLRALPNDHTGNNDTSNNGSWTAFSQHSLSRKYQKMLCN